MLSVLRGMHLRTILPAFLIKASKNSTITATGSEKQARSPKSQHWENPASAALSQWPQESLPQSPMQEIREHGRVPAHEGKGTEREPTVRTKADGRGREFSQRKLKKRNLLIYSLTCGFSSILAQCCVILISLDKREFIGLELKMSTEKYTTIGDVVNYEVAPALGEFVNDFDIDEIAREGRRLVHVPHVG